MTSAKQLLSQGLRRGALSLLAAALLLSAALPAGAGAAPPAPVLAINSHVSPTRLVPGEAGSYQILVTNIGGKPTDGSPITITAELPAGIALDPESGAPPLQINNSREQLFGCEAGPPVSCSLAGVLHSGESLVMTVPVKVAPSASGVEVLEISASGSDAPPVSASQSTLLTTELAAFGFESLETFLTGADGAPFTQAGGHPYNFRTGFQFNTVFDPAINGQPGALPNNPPAGTPKRVVAKLPPGLVLNPQATPRCTEAQLEALECPDASVVGEARATANLFSFSSETFPSPLFNMVPPPGHAAAFALNPEKLGIFVHILGGVDSAGDYWLTGFAEDIPQRFKVSGVRIDFWGVPSDPSHEYRRGNCAYANSTPPCPTEATGRPLLTMPSACSEEPLAVSVSAESWEEKGKLIDGSSHTQDAGGNPVGVEGCNALEFKPTISSQPTTNLADSPTGLDVTIHQPQNEELDGLATAALKDVTVTLPQGMTLNPSAGNGLAACSESQIGYQPSGGEIHFSEAPQSCPNAAKVGTLEVNTPLLDEKLPGSIYVAKPYANPFGSLLAIYLAIESPERGIVAKLAGEVTPDPSTGQLTARFKDNPQLPIEDIETHFFNGPRAALKTPLTCGTKTTTTTLVPWSTPEGADARPTSSFATSVPPNGGPCPTSEAQAPNSPAFTAGTLAPQAGAYSPFLLKLTRNDGSQRLTGIDATLPKGLTGKLAGVPYCSEAQIAAAKAREAPNQGAVEQSNPSCPLASEVGTVTVGAGAGITPLYVTGHAYLAGPYKGAPISLVVIVPAVAGPFDLGAVVSRTALYVNSETAQIHAVSDPLPSIIQGIPLDLRSIALKIDRPNFTLNPTSCDPTAITGAAMALTGQSAALTSPFQVGGCSALKFKPKLAISLKGGTKRSKNPALRAVVTYPKKGSYANIASAQVTLPHSAFLEQAHIGTVCTRVQFAADACPKASIYGFARAFTPLLDKPVEGPVYLRSSSHELPDLVAALEGQVNVDLVGRVDTGKGGGIRNTFEATPDAPVSKFVLEMKGGKKGLLVNSENICKKPQKALVSYRAHNGDAYQAQPLIKNDCGKKKHKAKKHRKAQR